MSSIDQLRTIQDGLTRYGMTTYLIVGNIGLILNILFFSQRSHRHNPCSLYLASSAICRCITLNVAIIPIIHALYHADSRNASDLSCKLQYYFRHAPNQMMRTFIMLACIDRYALCSMKRQIRAISQYSVALKLIPIVIIFWLGAASFIPALQAVIDGRCTRSTSAYALAYTIYNVVTTGLIPPIFLSIFSFAVIQSLKKIRSRVQPMNSTANAQNILRKADRDLIRMSLVEIITYLFTTTPYSISVIYSFAVSYTIKSSNQEKIESFISYLAQSFLLHLNNALPFWILLLTLRSFRTEFKNFVREPRNKLFGRAAHQSGNSLTATGKFQQATIH